GAPEELAPTGNQLEVRDTDQDAPVSRPPMLHDEPFLHERETAPKKIPEDREGTDEANTNPG
ncbi:MAG: hypothetical protein KC503_36475, partial [Myxococcales bacterium]|nr:hypothetical protein [Myxococcales bacterium]